MKNLIGNSFEIFLKGTDKSIEGLLIERDDKFDYVQKENSVCIIPVQNVLYYKTNHFSRSSKLINTIELPSVPEEKNLTIFVDKAVVAEVKIPNSLETGELIKFLYSNEIIRNSLRDKKQKSIEYFEDSVYIFTDKYHEKSDNYLEDETRTGPNPQPQVEFVSGIENPVNAYLSPSDMVARLNKIAEGKING